MPQLEKAEEHRVSRLPFSGNSIKASGSNFSLKHRCKMLAKPGDYLIP